ncbi:hypothetical protein STRAU_4765 [Streptomyces aurantiacus JA 4570]|uniref:Uncharacterized protein n=1 Tax=Streptomyces aurantiacus JA 4570 TaxID=1286094 RepID=S3ZUW0_9ACTN|nr:hypothetical protein STRAU_4765 [Streptomyces aurantiacus JA 4570]
MSGVPHTSPVSPCERQSVAEAVIVRDGRPGRGGAGA